MDDTRVRFLKAIAAQLDVERIAEVHLFPAIRQGGMESGVAVLALDLLQASEPIEVADIPSVEPTADAPSDAPRDEGDDAGPYAESDILHDTMALDDIEDDAPRPRPRRFTVYTARYRHTLKGPDRGKWEVSVTEEADAPLLTVDAVVRGVQRRSGDLDEIVRMTGSEVESATAAP
ncbi:MAG: hypothetical protein ABI601_20865, partial [bacterium]